MNNFERIPLELRAHNQWICWTLEHKDGVAKPTKIPRNPATGHKASVTDPSTWGTFEQACEAARINNTGIGFVLTPNDPFAFVDLDQTDDFTELQLQQQIATTFQSYAELSQSGTGLHIICKAAIPRGKRKGKIELYSSNRFMAMTGNVYRDSPIAEEQSTFYSLFEYLGGTSTQVVEDLTDEEATEIDEKVLERACGASNGEKFTRLLEGDWEHDYPSQSEADFAFVDIVAFYTQNRAQIARIFKNSPLGKRQKGRRPDYIKYMVDKSFDNQPPKVNLDMLKETINEELKALEAKPEPVHDEAEHIKADFPCPPGLIGDIARYVYEQAPRPVPEIATAAAIGLMAGIVGRAYNISSTGLNQYILMLAPTGCHAKDARILMFDGSVKLVQDVQIGDLLMGPDSQPRRVLNLARGREQMARITPTKGEPFVVNCGHILPLVSSDSGKRQNVTVHDYVNKSKWFKHCHKLQRTGVEFADAAVSVNPWFLGAMLGDGCFVGSPSLTGMDEEVHGEAERHAQKFGVKIGSVSQPSGNAAWQSRFTSKRGSPNLLTCELKWLGLWNKKASEKFVPEVYKRNSRTVRLELLAGLIDTDGSLSCNGYDFVSKSERLANDVVFVARSLGLAAYVKQCVKSCQTGAMGTYYRVSISGNTAEIPVRLARKKASKRRQKKNVLVTGFTVEMLPEDYFYGFALDSDHLYLTDDFTIHHNTGKEAIAKGIESLMQNVQKTVPAANEFVGPGEIASPQALIKYMSKGPNSFVSVVGEFGIALKQMTDPRAPTHLVGLRRTLLDLFNKSGNGQALRPTIYADKDKNTDTVISPAYTVLGESTPERFYDALDESMISEGLLPRFTIIEYKGKRPPLNPGHAFVKPSHELVDSVAKLCANALMLNKANRAINVELTAEARELFDLFNVDCDNKINKSESEVTRHLWNRAHIKALKMAGLVAVGCNPYTPTVDADCARWAIQIITNDAHAMLDKFGKGEFGGDASEPKQVRNMIEAIKDYLTRPYEELAKYVVAEELYKARVVPYGYIQRRLVPKAAFKSDRMGATNAIKRTIQTLIDRGDISELSRADVRKILPGSTGRCFALLNTKSLK